MIQLAGIPCMILLGLVPHEFVKDNKNAYN